MISRIFYILFFLNFTICCLFADDFNENQYLEMSSPSEVYDLNKAWNFTPIDDIDSVIGENQKNKWYELKIPGAWNITSPEFRSYQGSALYRVIIDIKLVDSNENIGLLLPFCFGQIQVRLNNEIIYKNDKFFGTKPILLQIKKSDFVEGKNYIDLRTTAYSGWGGFSGYFKIGSFNKLNNFWISFIIKNVSIVFISLFLSIYFIIYYFFKKKENYNLTFSLLCLSVGFFIMGYYGLWFYIFDYSWAYWLFTFIGGIAMYLLPILFIHSFFNIKLSKLSKAFSLFYIILAVFVLVEYLLTRELYLFNTYLYMFFNLSYILLVVYLIIVGIKALNKNLSYSKMMFTGILLLSITFIFSMLVFATLINSAPLIGEGFFAMVIVFSIVLAKRFAQTHSDLELSHALNLELNSTLENKVNYRTRELNLRNQEVTESIEYAALIQNSILPSNDSLARSLSDFYVCWKPKGIVGGDFYWFNSKGDDFLVAIVDCTGHGVPGAMLTMTATSVLERVIAHINRTNPAKILNEMNKILKSILQREDTDYVTDDGLDIGLCYYNSRDKLLTYAGSRIRLHVVEEGYLREFKGDSQGIGYERSKEDYEYTNHEIKVTKDLSFYMTTDGYLDQSGGDFEFGFGWSKYKRLLVENHEDDMGTQLIKLEQALDKYQKDFEQRDDITLLGFKVKIDE